MASQSGAAAGRRHPCAVLRHSLRAAVPTRGAAGPQSPGRALFRAGDARFRANSARTRRRRGRPAASVDADDQQAGGPARGESGCRRDPRPGDGGLSAVVGGCREAAPRPREMAAVLGLPGAARIPCGSRGAGGRGRVSIVLPHGSGPRSIAAVRATRSAVHASDPVVAGQTPLGERILSWRQGHIPWVRALPCQARVGCSRSPRGRSSRSRRPIAVGSGWLAGSRPAIHRGVPAARAGPGRGRRAGGQARRVRKKERMSSARRSGTSKAGKWPPSVCSRKKTVLPSPGPRTLRTSGSL